jgi:hypothetical protein
MNLNTKQDVFDIVKYLALGSLSGVSIGSLFNLISNYLETSTNNKVEDKIQDMAEPYKIVSINRKDLKNKSKLNNLDEDLSSDLLEKKSSLKDKITEESLIPNYLSVILKGGAGVLGLLTGIYGTNKLFNYLKQNNLEQELEESKKQYYTTLFMRKNLEDLKKEKELKEQKSMYRYASELNLKSLESSFSKYASNKMSTIDWIIAGGIGTVALTAIMHAIAARRLAKAKNPYDDNREKVYTAGLTQADVRNPIVKFVVTDDNKDEEAIKKELKALDIDDKEKLNKIDVIKLSSCVLDNVSESIVKLAAELERKALTNGGVNDFIETVALGEIDILKNSNTFEEMMNKASSFAESNKKVASEAQKSIAVSYIVSDPVLSSMFVPYAASEVLSHSEPLEKLASQIEFNENDITDACEFVAMKNIVDKCEVLEPLLKRAFVTEEDIKNAPSNEYKIHETLYNVLTNKVKVEGIN